MSSETVNEQQILEALQQVPGSRWEEVLTFIRSLEPSPPVTGETRPLTAADLLHSDLVGLWAGRTDIGDSREFARHLREQAQTRERDA